MRRWATSPLENSPPSPPGKFFPGKNPPRKSPLRKFPLLWKFPSKNTPLENSPSRNIPSRKIPPRKITPLRKITSRKIRPLLKFLSREIPPPLPGEILVTHYISDHFEYENSYFFSYLLLSVLKYLLGMYQAGGAPSARVWF